MRSPKKRRSSSTAAARWFAVKRLLALGSFRIHLIRAGVYYWDGGAFFGVVPKTLWGARIPCDELNRVPAAFNCYLVETGAQNILIETGGGDRHDDLARERMRLAPEHDLLGRALREAGFEKSDIDLVINTHLHWDHCGGNTLGEGEPAFSNARYITQRGEWEHAQERHPRDAVSYRDINYQPLLDSGRMQLLSGDAEVAPGVSLEVVRGHNASMMIVRVRSDDQTFCMFADLIPTAVNLPPTWVAAFDLYPLESISNKFRLLKQAAEEQWWCGFAHDHAIAFTKIRHDQGSRYSLYETLT